MPQPAGPPGMTPRLLEFSDELVVGTSALLDSVRRARRD
jgi:hypothetical protein